MRKFLGVLMFSVLLLGFATNCFSDRGDWRGGIRERIHHARMRIDRGIENGSLTHREARSLRDELRVILFRINQMKSDGDFSPEERERVNLALDRLERRISWEKHDQDRRGEHYRDRY